VFLILFDAAGYWKLDVGGYVLFSLMTLLDFTSWKLLVFWLMMLLVSNYVFLYQFAMLRWFLNTKS
jgi:hypothetical protein